VSTHPRLQALTAGRSIVCQEKDRDRYGRNLGAILLREGLAWAFTRFSVDYVDQQEEAPIAGAAALMLNCDAKQQVGSRVGF